MFMKSNNSGSEAGSNRVRQQVATPEAFGEKATRHINQDVTDHADGDGDDEDFFLDEDEIGGQQ